MTDDEEWRGVLVVGELDGDDLATYTLELLAKAREITDQLGGRLSCVLVGEIDEDTAETAVHHGADRVLLAQQPHDGLQPGPLVQPLARLVEDRRPEIVLLSATDLGRDLAPMLGARLDTGVANECVDLELDVSERKLRAKRHVYGGRLEETLTVPQARPQIASLRPGAAREGFPDEMRFGDVETVDLDLDDAPDLVGRQEGEPPELTQADRVVVGGRGVGDEDWAALEDLAETMGAALGATRGAVHGGRADEEVMVDATQHSVKPQLYLGLGVSGQFEHLMAIDGAEWVVGVNPDDEAPIMEGADWGLAADPAEVARALREEIEDKRA